MKIILLGTGCPSVDPNRYGPSNLIYTNNTKILIDCGSGITQRLFQSGYQGSEIDYLLLTHLHSDHVVDFYQLIISSWHQYRKKPWKIIGPLGTKKFINQIMDSWQDERNLRIEYEKRESINAFELEITEIETEGKIKLNDIDLEYFDVDHKPVQYAFGYNFINNGKKITISGDTRPCKNIEKYSINSDLLIHEVFIEGEIVPINGMRSEETLHNVKAYHTLSTEVGKIAKKVQAKNLVLTHFVPPNFDEKKLMKLISNDYGKEPIIGKDLMTVDTDGKIYYNNSK